MVNVIVIGIVLAILGLASFYIWKKKKKGTRCIGCPSGGDCNQCGSSCREN